MQITRNPIRDDVQIALREMISSGKLYPGQRLKEVSLAETLGVGRTPVREALLALEKDGFVISETNKGCSVVSMTAARIREAYLICGALEALAVKMTPEFTAGHIDALRALNLKIENAKSRGAKYRHDAAWHRMLSRACGGGYLLGVLHNAHDYARCFDGGERRGIVNSARTVREHGGIIDAIEKNKISQAARLLEAHWAGGVETVVDWLTANGQIDTIENSDGKL